MKQNCQFIAMNSIPSSQTVLTMYNKLTMVMLPAGVKNSQDYDSRDFLSCVLSKRTAKTRNNDPPRQ